LVPRLAFRYSPDLVYHAFLDVTFRDRNRVSRAVREEYRKMFHEKKTVDYWIRLYRTMAKGLIRQQSPRPLKRFWNTTRLKMPSPSKDAFKVPLSLIWGADDTFNPMWIAEDLERRLREAGSDVTLHKVADSGHFVPEEQPNEVANLIIAHLNRREKQQGS